MSTSPKTLLTAFRAVSLVLLIVIACAACNKGFKDYYSDRSPKGGYLYDKIKNNAEFSMFARGLERADLVQFIDKGGLYTVFAPTNDALSKFLTASNFKSIEDVPANTLYKLLSYHIVNNMWYYYDLKVRYASFQQRLFLTRNQKFVNIDVTRPDTIKVNDIPVINALRDIDADNGVVHGISQVLVPLPNLEEMFMSDPELANSTFYRMMQVVKDSTFDRVNSFDTNRDGVIDSIFYKTYPALSNVFTTTEFRQNTAPASQGGDPQFTTLMVPSNQALLAFIAPALAKVDNKIDSLSPSYVEAVLESYFISDSIVTSQQLVSRALPLRSVDAELIPTLTTGDFTRRDLRASNGMIHMINKTFPVTATARLNSAIGKIMTEPDYFIFLAAIKKASLNDAWATTIKTGTFFAPNNAAFNAIGFDVKKGTLNGAVLTTTQLSNLMRNHLINENLTQANLTGTPSVSKNSDVGATQPLIFTNNGTTVTTTEGVIATVSYPELSRGPGSPAVGYVYKVDKVLIPKQ